MYLDTHERGEMRAVVLGFHIHWFLCTMEHISRTYVRTAFLLFVFYVAALAVAGLMLNVHGWIIWVFAGMFIGLLFVFYRRHRKRVQDIVENNTPDIWLQEIEQLDTDGEERELFLQILSAMRTGTKDEVLRAVEEASRSPQLFQLAFIRELRADLQ